MVTATEVLTEPLVGEIVVTVVAVELLTVNVVLVVPPLEFRTTRFQVPIATPLRLKIRSKLVVVSVVDVVAPVMVVWPDLVRDTVELLNPEPVITIV